MQHSVWRREAHLAALAACLLAMSTQPALAGDDAETPSAPASKHVVTPVRVAQGLNLGDACERYYPLSSRMAHEFGATTLVVYVDVDGRVKETRIETGSGYVALDEAAEQCIVERGRYVAQTVDSIPVGSWQRMKFTWRLDNPAGADAANSLLSAYRKGDYARLAKLLVPYARDGAIDAQVLLARMYLHGTGVTANPVEAATWMRKAAERGSTVAEYDAGIFSEEGVGGPKDYAAAASWFRKAGHQRHADAAFNLALMYQSGLGVERDPAMALVWIEAAIGFLASPSADAVRPGYVSTRDSILASMSPAQIDAASRITSPDGPVIRGYLRNRAAIDKAASDAYPSHLGEHDGVRAVSLLVFVLADGHVADTRVENSSGLPKLDAATVQVLSQADIMPKKISGQSVDAWQLVTWTWALR
ncbi:MAG: SEL1-like repeat protein [Proteobacteria bacterium]|nr:SEL1-like repeat protein [Pseudomonadota bacterium]